MNLICNIQMLSGKLGYHKPSYESLFEKSECSLRAIQDELIEAYNKRMKGEWGDENRAEK